MIATSLEVSAPGAVRGYFIISHTPAVSVTTFESKENEKQVDGSHCNEMVMDSGGQTTKFFEVERFNSYLCSLEPRHSVPNYGGDAGKMVAISISATHLYDFVKTIQLRGGNLRTDLSPLWCILL